ncbi:MAG: amino acid adenylation domain-containing protein [Ginsengibacter sp.]
MPDGEIAFVGRKDGQVKIKGNRIEPGEVENTLMQHQDYVKQAVVLVKKFRDEDTLVAYVVPEKSYDESKLRRGLAKYLPYYMMPTHIVLVKSIPLTLNGKVDTKSLPDLFSQGTAKEFLAPRNETEIRLAEIWQELLGKSEVGLLDDFFELGGNSLKAISIIATIYKTFQVKLEIKDFFINNVFEDQAALIERSRRLEYKEIPLAESRSYYPLSPSQQRLWLLYQMDKRSTAYNIYGAHLLEGDIEPDLFIKALQQLLRRHEMLRTIFIEKEGSPVQQIIPYDSLDIEKARIDISHEAETTAPGEREAVLSQHVFSLDQWPLFKFSLIKEQNGYRLLYVMHHIISDGWSMDIFVKDIFLFYQSMLTGARVELPALTIQYKDYAAWQNDLLAQGLLNKEQRYWVSQLEGDLPILHLPQDNEPLDGVSRNNAGFYKIYLDEELKSEIDQFVVHKKISTFGLFIGCFKVLLHRLTGQRDIIIGIPVANRSHEAVKDLIGFFVNTIMLRDRFTEAMSFSEFVKKVNDNLMDGLENQSYPFERLLEVLQIPKDLNHFPISRVFLNMLNFSSPNSANANGVTSQAGVTTFKAKFDLECYFEQQKDALLVNCIYNRDLFQSQTIEYWINGFISIIRASIQNPAVPIDEIPVFDRLLPAAAGPVPSNPFTYFPKEAIQQSLVTRFEEQVEKYTAEIAISTNGETITYAELNALANGLAAAIMSLVGAPAPVALLLEHGKEAVIGITGVLKSGNIYVPLDLYYPIGRLKDMLEDSQCKVIIASRETIELATDLAESMEGITIINTAEGIMPRKDNINATIQPNNKSYVLYTSGSTGMPKGVIQTHRNVLHFIRTYTNNLHIGHTDKVSLLPTYSFDASVMDIFGALLNGAALYVYDLKKDGLAALHQWLQLNEITIFHTVPTVYRHLIAALDTEMFNTIRLVVLGGEAVFKRDFDHFKIHFKPGAIFINGYGPTESTVTLQKFLDHTSAVHSRNISIGFPVSDTNVYLLDKSDKPVGIYETGELVYKSEFLSLGYLNKPELTDRVFTVDPVKGRGRVYRSGDIGRLLPSGEIEFVGREDFQIKINGQRIEIAEIEQTILKLQRVKEAVVLYRQIEGQGQLIAYIVADPGVQKGEVKTFLKMNLPSYMVPAHYVLLNQMPLTPTGKVDRKSLPDPQQVDVRPKQAAQQVLTRTEGKLIEICQEILGRPDLQIEEDFFDLGGNSLKVLSLVNKIKSDMVVELKMREVFITSTLREIAVLIDKGKKTLTLGVIHTVPLQPYYKITKAQLGIWYTSQLNSIASSAYNIVQGIRIEGVLDEVNLRRALEQVIHRHESLRTVFVLTDEGVCQKIIDVEQLGATLFVAYEEEQRTGPERERFEALIIQQEAMHVFDLESGPLLRVRYIILNEKSSLLFINIHHIICDGSSIRIIIRDFFKCYSMLSNKAASPMTTLPVQFKDYASYLNNYLDETGAAHRQYWLNQLLPFCSKRKTKRKVDDVAKAFKGNSLAFQADEQLVEAVSAFIREGKVTEYVFYSSIIAIILSEWTGEQDIVLLSPFSTRVDMQLEQQVGLYLNTVPLVIRVKEGDSFARMLHEVKQTTLSNYDHLLYPFPSLVEDLNETESNLDKQLFNAMFTLQNQEKGHDILEKSIPFQISTIANKSETAKFPITISLTPHPLLIIHIEYDTDIFTMEEMTSFMNRFVELVKFHAKPQNL